MRESDGQLLERDSQSVITRGKYSVIGPGSYFSSPLIAITATTDNEEICLTKLSPPYSFRTRGMSLSRTPTDGIVSEASEDFDADDNSTVILGTHVPI